MLLKEVLQRGKKCIYIRSSDLHVVRKSMKEGISESRVKNFNYSYFNVIDINVIDLIGNIFKIITETYTYMNIIYVYVYIIC